MADIREISYLIDNELKHNKDPQAIVDELSMVLGEVGERYEKGQMFLSELIYIGYLASEVAAQLKPYISSTNRRSRGKILIGTVRGDIHDIGKNIVIMMLQADGWEVVDLGVDVPPEKFVNEVKIEEPTILALSALLSSTIVEFKNVIEHLEKSGLRSNVKVIVGGRPVTREITEEIGADDYAEDAIAAIKVIRKMAHQEE